MLSVNVTEPGKLDLVDIPIPQPGPYEVRIRTELATLCNATDRKLIEGHFPGVDDYPLILGHESVGIVDAVGEKVRYYQKGDRVVGGLLLNPTNPDFFSGYGGFCEWVLAGDHQAMVEDGMATAEYGWEEVHEIMTVVPADIPVEAAVLLCTWREVLGSIGDFGLHAGSDLLVFGCGPVGLSYIKFARLLGFNRVVAVDPNEPKREKALSMGCDEAVSPAEIGARAKIAGEDGKFDAVVDCVGKQSVLDSALSLVEKQGAICLYGILDTPVLHVEHGLGPHNFALKFHQWPLRAGERQAQHQLCGWIRAGQLSPSDFVSAEYPIFEIATAYKEAIAQKQIKTLLRYP